MSSDPTLTPFLNAVDWPVVTRGVLREEVAKQADLSVGGAFRRAALRLLMHVVREPRNAYIL